MDEKARIYLEDGTVIEGEGFGANAISCGEVVFTTSMNGYPESLTDPSYKSQILVMTHPLVGNYGVPKRVVRDGILENFESERIAPSGLIVSEATSASKWNSDKDLSAWLRDEKVPGISGIDTRELTKKIRDMGVMRGVIANGAMASGADVKKLLGTKYGSRDLIEAVSPKKPIFHLNEKSRRKIVVVDFGVKHGVLSSLHSLGYNIIRVPYDYSASKVASLDPDGILYSNGPGDPNRLDLEVAQFKEILGYNIPVMGLCLGHQIAVLALGGGVEKMKFGHRATNKPVIDLESKRAYITTHNHGYATYKNALPAGMKEWFRSVDDWVVEGTKSARHNLITTQFHPEARPGTKDAHFVFRVFDKMINDGNR